MVDVVDSKSTASDGVPVRVRSPAPNQYNPNLVFPVGDGFGLFVFFGRFEETHFRNGVIKRPESTPRGPRKKKQIWEDTVMDQNNQILIYQSFILSRGMRKEWRTEFENSRI